MSQNEIQQSSLFRPEVTASLSHQWMGSIRLAQQISSWLVSGVAIAISAAFLAFVCLGSVTKKAHVTGILIPAKGTVGISAASAGVLVRNVVSEGQHVRAGATLFELSTERQGSNGELSFLIAQQLASRAHGLEAEQRLRTAQYREKKAALTQRLQALDAEGTQLAQEMELAARRLHLAQQSLGKFETLQASGYVSSAQTQQKQDELIDLSARLSNLGRTQVQLRASRQDVEAELAAQATSLESDLTQLQQAKALLQQEVAENSNRKSFLITAPQDGVVTTITYQPGQAVGTGQVLATLIPEQGTPPGAAPELEVQLYAPSRTAGFVAPGQTVLLRYQAFPYQKFGLQKGVVTDVSKTPFAPNELPQNLASTILSNAQQNLLGFNSNEALYRIRVRPEKQYIDVYGHPQVLKPGMTLEADVLQDSRKIWEWIAEPLLAMRSY
jgi:membrane fusion protein